MSTFSGFKLLEKGDKVSKQQKTLRVPMVLREKNLLSVDNIVLVEVLQGEQDVSCVKLGIL